MARKSAIRLRMDLAIEVDPSNLSSVGEASKKIEALKGQAKELGFRQTDDPVAKLGSVNEEVFTVDDYKPTGEEVEEGDEE